MYIAIVKDDKKEMVYRACSKTIIGLTRTFLAMESASHINGLVYYGTNVDMPSCYAFKVIKKGKVKTATLWDLTNQDDTLHDIVQYAKEHGAYDIKLQSN